VHLTIALIVGTLYFKIGQDAAYVLDNFNLSYYNIMFLMYNAFSATMVTSKFIALAQSNLDIFDIIYNNLN